MKKETLGLWVIVSLLLGLTIVLAILKLTIVEWSWWIVFLPLWVPLVLLVVMGLVVTAGYTISVRHEGKGKD
ncbi:MAG: hypothetical protein K2G69_07020 [Muribaculaceae bacterium]|nr:hypothetical protein [Muribaculaceae bacterium]